MTAAQRVFKACEELGWSQRQLAERAELSSGYLTHLKHGMEDSGPSRSQIQNPTIDTLERIAAAMRLPLVWLALGEGPEPNWEELRRGAA